MDQDPYQLHSTVSDERTLSALEDLNFGAKFYLENGLSADEAGNKNLAIKHYLDALQCLEAVFDVDESDVNVDLRPVIQSKQSNVYPILQQVRTRLYELQEQLQPTAPISTSSSRLPTVVKGNDIEDSSRKPTAPIFTSNSRLPTVVEDDIIKDLSRKSSLAGFENALELLYIPGGVQLFAVEENLEVNAAPPSYPSSLSIFKLENVSDSSKLRPSGFIQVGDWVYPLVPGHSPVLQCSNGAFVFPNLTTNQSTSHSKSIGLVLSSDLQPVYEEVFVNLLKSMADLQKQEHLPENEPVINLKDTVSYKEPATKYPATTSQKIASEIESGANWISRSLVKGAEITAGLIKQSADFVKRNIKPNERPTKINPVLEKGLNYTHEASKATVKVSFSLVKGLCYITKEIAQGIKPHLVQLLPNTDESQGNSRHQNAMLIANAGLEGFGTIWTGLEASGMAIARSVSQATVDTVRYKYGEEAGKSTGHVMGTAVNCAKTAFNIDNLGLKAIAKRTAKDTGKAVIKEYDSKPNTANERGNNETGKNVYAADASTSSTSNPK